MPRVRPLTAAQEKKQVYENRSATLAKGLGAAQSFHRINNEALGNELGLSKNTVPKLLKGEDVRMSVTAFWKALDLAGLEIRPKPVKLDL